MNGVIQIVVLIVSVIFHECAHGFVALWLGDNTAKAAGRLTLNPLKHIDPFGSVMLPLLMYFTVHSMFGYAKPVPVSPRGLRGTDRWGFAAVALAGPISNMIIAMVAATILKRVGDPRFPLDAQPALLARVMGAAFAINILLAAFNLIPIPPLDGSRLLRPFIGQEGRRVLDRIEPFGFVIILILVSTRLSEPLFRLIGLIESGLLRLLPV